MASLILFWIYVGGWGPAYAKNRETHGKFWSGVEALMWPGGLGQYIARKFYEEW